MVGDFAAEFDGETARLSIKHVYPEDEGEYTCVAYNDLGKAYTSACLVVDGNFNSHSHSIAGQRRFKNKGRAAKHADLLVSSLSTTFTFIVLIVGQSFKTRTTI